MTLPCPTLPLAAKSDRLKQAKAEAEKEIKAYQQDRENAYQQKLSSVSMIIIRCSALPAACGTQHNFWLLFSTAGDPPQNTSNAGDTSKRLASESAKQEGDIKSGVQANKAKVRFP